MFDIKRENENDGNDIPYAKALENGTYLGYFYERKNGFGPEFWKMDVFDIHESLYTGDEGVGVCVPMMLQYKKKILASLNHD